MKKKIFLLIASIINIIMINDVYAFTFSIPTVNTGGNNGNGESEPTGSVAGKSLGNSGVWTYSCYYDYDIWITNNVTIDMYDLDGNHLNPNRLLPETHKFLAGTSIGLNISEDTYVNWKIYNVKVLYEHKKHYCDYKYLSCKKWNYNENGHITSCATYGYSYVYDVENNYYTSCPETRPILSNIGYVTGQLVADKNSVERHADWTSNASWIEKCKKKAYADVESKINEGYNYPSYKAVYYNSNDINEKGIEKEINSSNIKSDYKGYINVEVTEKYNVPRYTFYYNLTKTCINVKTGDVSYRTSNSSCNKDEMEVPTENSKIKMKYFIPLNAKNTDDFILSLKTWQSDTWKNYNSCKHVMEKYEDWRNLIVVKKGRKDTEVISFSKNTTYDDALGMVYDYGCYIETVVHFPIEQKFYNEEEENDKTVFVGFNFYYKPIDITNPFPNGVASDSLWKGLWNSKTNKVTTSKNTTVNLSNSFTNTTYVATNLKLNKIRNYGNETNQLYYTSWSDMYTSGRSQFVDKYVTRTSYASYYALGCGPANASWEECKK